MGSAGKFARSLGWLIAFAVTLGPGIVGVAEDPPKEDPKAGEQQADAPPAGSLAAAAAKIKLKKPEGEDSGSLVISDQNVKAAGEGASVSQGGALAAAPAAQVAATGSQASAQANAVADELQAQRIKVQNMEEQLANYDRQLAEPGPDPHYPKYSDAPQFRSPGVVDPAQGKRDQLADQLEQERAKLAELEKRATRAGVKHAEPVPAAAPAPN